MEKALPLLMLVWALAPIAAPAQEAPREPPRLVLVDDSAVLDAALASRTPPHDLPVRVSGLSLPATDPALVRLLVVASIEDEREGGPPSSVAYEVEAGGTRHAHGLRRVVLRGKRGGSLSFVAIVSVPPGDYHLKLAVLRQGRVGVAEAPVSARLHARGGVRLGDLLLGDERGEVTETLTPDRRLRRGLLVATLPIDLGSARPENVSMALEVATDASGAAMLSEELSLLEVEGQSRFAQASFDTTVLPAGDYVARAIVRVSADEAQVVAPFTLERAVADAAGATGTRSESAVAALDAGADVPAFRLEDVLDPAVVGPFLDDLASRAGNRAKPAIDRARAGRYDEAAAAAPASPDDPARPFLQGLSLLSRRQLQAASDAFHEALRASPDYFVGAFYIGACYAAGGRDPQAVSAWQTSLVGLEEHKVVFRLLGEALTRMGHPGRALAPLEEASAKWPDEASFRLQLARAALAAGRYDRAIEVVEAHRGAADPELLFAGMQAIFTQVTQGGGEADGAEALKRMKRHREAYVAAGGTRQALVDAWVAAVGKASQGPR